MKTVAIIQARMGSTRLPGKVMKQLKGKSVLYHVIQRVKQVKMIDEIVLATTTLDEDDVLAEKAKQYGVCVFRGSSENVLSRYYEAAKERKADVVVRITSDCPLIDPLIINKMLEYYNKNDYDVVTNAGSDSEKRTYPRGLDTEIFSFKLLENAMINGNKDYHKEHVTPYIYENSNDVYHFLNDKDFSKYRCTLDTPEDFLLISKIYNELYKGEHSFYLKDIISVFEKNPDYFRINSHVEQKKLN